jgi:hypothetical protein
MQLHARRWPKRCACSVWTGERLKNLISATRAKDGVKVGRQTGELDVASRTAKGLHLILQSGDASVVEMRY